MKTGALFFVIVVSVIIGLILGSETVRWLMAGALAVVAVPLWASMRHFFQRQFWRDVGDVIAASGAQRPKEPPFDQE